MRKVKVVIGIDVETDVGSWTTYYQGVEKGIPILLDIFQRQKVKATFFFTGDVAEKFPKSPRSVLKSGHEVGCHTLYHETVGDELFPIPGVKPLLPEEVFLRLKKATEFVEKAAGVKPVSFRAPRLWGSTAMVNALEKLGYKADASYPLYFYRKRLFPYHPSRKNWLEEGESRVLEIPNFADISQKSKDPYGRDLDQWPTFRTDGAKVLMKKVKRFVEIATLPLVARNDNAKRKEPVLCFYFHPWEFVPMAKRFHYGEGTVIPDYFCVKNCGPKAAQELERMIVSLKKDYDAQFFTAEGLADIW
ncbi:MAG: Peptidoglycan deacetylase [Dehalococcoidia bacterium]|nr:Peptidoglycan deacetylase [Bacillota bacterium]